MHRLKTTWHDLTSKPLSILIISVVFGAMPSLLFYDFVRTPVGRFVSHSTAGDCPCCITMAWAAAIAVGVIVVVLWFLGILLCAKLWDQVKTH